MTHDEDVTTWSPAGKTARDLCRALDVHLAKLSIEPEEYSFDATTVTSRAPLPADRRWLVAFAVEGANEGYYVHVGAIIPPSREASASQPARYEDIGFCKTYSAESAYTIAREAQRFLTSCEWH